MIQLKVYIKSIVRISQTTKLIKENTCVYRHCIRRGRGVDHLNNSNASVQSA